ncbi:hypothetical protein EXU48_05600 [Occultella glacieicola]|uniref:Uncharacterized protein n=1 Tax=Occultella glacieicola TaxID=2518684 RepID=A0ABY2E8Z5_9MICO|nr:hypothetical protein [Occultella glacieicola]TDE95745.1 hypothetical protein EXU48_05600 [Occultella glacieicola]
MEIARQRLRPGQGVLDLGPDPGGSSGVGARVAATRSRLLWEVLTDAYVHLGFDALGDEAFAAMALARIIEPTSKADTVRVLAEIGAPCPSLRTLFRSLKRCHERDYRDTLATASLAHSARTCGKAALIMYEAPQV